MAWYDEAIFYHIYPLGLTGAPARNDGSAAGRRLNTLVPWIAHLRTLGCSALYIGPLFESVGHGYETTDYRKLDSRLGTNEDLKAFVAECHSQRVRVVFDGVFNHTGREFFAFRDILANRENSPYRDWYGGVDFNGNNGFGDGFSCENWGGDDALPKLNHRNPQVRSYLLDAVRFWVEAFDVDGIRLDAADVLDFGFMHELRRLSDAVKPDFWLMGEVIHGNYGEWVNGTTLHSVTNYQLYKALYSGHNDRNYFEIAHTVRSLIQRLGETAYRLYNFVDNHDVERIYTRLADKKNFKPVHLLLYSLPGIPSIYYGSEFGIEGRKERFSDESLRPALDLSEASAAAKASGSMALIQALGSIRRSTPALRDGAYTELLLTNRQYAFSRANGDETALIAVNNDDQPARVEVAASGRFIEALTGEIREASDGRLPLDLGGNDGQIWIRSKAGS